MPYSFVFVLHWGVSRNIACHNCLTSKYENDNIAQTSEHMAIMRVIIFKNIREPSWCWERQLRHYNNHGSIFVVHRKIIIIIISIIITFIIIIIIIIIIIMTMMIVIVIVNIQFAVRMYYYTVYCLFMPRSLWQILTNYKLTIDNHDRIACSPSAKHSTFTFTTVI